MKHNRQQILDRLDDELRRQKAIGKPMEQPALVWGAILAERVGLYCRAIFAMKPTRAAKKELLQVAAVAIAAIENIEREEEFGELEATQ